jgi:hypothetical protein
LEKDIGRTRPEFDVDPTPDPIASSLFVFSAKVDSEPVNCIFFSFNSDDLAIPLKHVRDMIEELSSRELYGIVPFQVHEQFIDSFVSKWESISMQSFEKVEKVLRGMVEKLCQGHFGRFQSSGLLYEVR